MRDPAPWTTLAPNANPVAYGGSAIGNETTARLFYCPSCRRLYALHWGPR